MEEAQFYKKLVERYVAKKLSPEELEVFYHLLNEGKLDSYILSSMEEETMAAPGTQQRKVWKLPAGQWIKLAIASCIIILLGVTLFSWHHHNRRQAAQMAGNKQRVPDKAILVLSSGDTIYLNDAPQGKLKALAGLQIMKDEDGVVSYVAQKNDQTITDSARNTIKVPAGGLNRIVLEDGTKVWLNASSSLTFPSSFTEKERKVQLSGEAYFEVTSAAKAGHRPFIVETATQKIAVLGTSFNISAYQDEQETKTSLLEGKVSVSTPKSTTVLKPGQQARVSREGNAAVMEVDPETVMDWKNGDFVFADEDLKSIMRKLSRWYDVAVVYEEEGMAAETFSGRISRSKKLTDVLHLLSLSGEINYQLKNNVLYLSSKRK